MPTSRRSLLITCPNLNRTRQRSCHLRQETALNEAGRETRYHSYQVAGFQVAPVLQVAGRYLNKSECVPVLIRNYALSVRSFTLLGISVLKGKPC